MHDNWMKKFGQKKYYIPQLEIVMVDEKDEVIGYAMFSHFHIEGRYENELLIGEFYITRQDGGGF